MKLFQFVQEGYLKTGVEIDGKHYDTSDYYPTYDELFFQNDGIKKLELDKKLAKDKEIIKKVVISAKNSLDKTTKEVNKAVKSL